VSVFWSDPVVPPELERYWNLKVYDPTTCPRQLDPDEGALVVTNYHQLLRPSEDLEVRSTLRRTGRSSSSSATRIRRSSRR
jgi:hypothetical protein